MRKRTLSREFALQILYQREMTKLPIVHVIERFWEGEAVADDEVKDFTSRLVIGVDHEVETIDQSISKYATNWQLKRMAVIDRNILRMGVFELQFAEDIPPKVTINEMVELAKKFGDLESSKFVNGILDKIHKTQDE